MKNYNRYIFLLCITITLFTNAQNAYLDAKHMVNSDVNETITNLNEMIKNCEWGDDTEDNKEKLINFIYFLENPFNDNLGPIDYSEISEIIKNAHEIDLPMSGDPDGSSDTATELFYKSKIDELKLSQADLVNAANSTIPAGVSPTTEIIDGVSKLLAERVKKELTITFFENFEDKLNKKYKVNLVIDDKEINIDFELKNVMPNTFLLIESKDFFAEPSFGQTWITAFKKDITKLPFSVAETFRKNDDFIKTKIGRTANIMLEVVENVNKGYHPIEIIENFGTTFNKYDTYKLDRYLGLLYLLSNNSVKKNSDNEKEWISLNDLNNLSNQEIKYFIGLIYQKGLQNKLLESININDTATLQDLINEDDYLPFFNTVKTVVTEFTLIKEKIKAIKEEKEDKEKAKKYFEYANSIALTLDKTIESTLRLVDNTNYYNSDYYTNYKPIITDVITFLNTIGNENYGESLLTAVSFLKHIFKDEENNELIRSVTFYGNFLVDIIGESKKDDNNVKAILEKYVLPVSSYRIKRRYDYSWDVSAYPGLYLGYEFSKSDSPNFGVTAPIGFSYSWNHKKERTSIKKSSAASGSIFVSAIDIGAPFSFRFKNDEAEGLPENIEWEQIFAPGLFYVYGFKDSPLAISVGAQYTPLLRKIEENNVLDEKSVIRFSASLTVDIPLFNLKRAREFKVKTKKKKQRK